MKIGFGAHHRSLSLPRTQSHKRRAADHFLSGFSLDRHLTRSTGAEATGAGEK